MIWDHEHRALTIGLVLTVAFTAFEALAVATVLPVTVKEIGGLHLYGWAFSGFMLASLIGIVAAGRASDVRGPAHPFTLGAALFVAGLVIGGVATSMPVVVVGRIVQGFGAGAISAVSYAAIAAAYPDDAKPRMLALLSSAWVIPGLIGPALAGLIADHVGWRFVFLGLAPPTLIGAALAIPPLRRLPRGGTPAPGSGDRTRAAIALAAGVGCALWGLDRGVSWRALAALLAGLALALPALASLLPVGTLRAATGQPAAIALLGLLGFAFFGSEAFLPLALTDVRGQPASLAGLPLTLGTLTWTAGAWIQAREAPRRSRAVLVALGVALMAIGIAITATILLPQAPLAVATLGWGINALGMGIAYSTCALVILELAPEGQEGESSAALQLTVTLGTALGTGAGGAVLATMLAAGSSTTRAIAANNAADVAALVLALLVALGRLPHRAPAARRESRGQPEVDQRRDAR